MTQIPREIEDKLVIAIAQCIDNYSKSGWQEIVEVLKESPWKYQPVIALLHQVEKRGRIDETTKWRDIAKLSREAYIKRGLSLEIPIDSQIRECEKRIKQLEEQL